MAAQNLRCVLHIYNKLQEGTCGLCKKRKDWGLKCLMSLFVNSMGEMSVVVPLDKQFTDIHKNTVRHMHDKEINNKWERIWASTQISCIVNGLWALNE